ncbi:hypothetical protein BOX15_Mlig031389g2 [Macrostomum lignano]|uniref:Major facilitator superfamily (MFS) profile domain-containing protein n=1 Tax=Macrostomum lignano TaxID=282301 RepID=A0A267ESK8_9PLAT|nr:hypothetical protein BOX15_Mlig031389g2 [Macrostomum lignano]
MQKRTMDLLNDKQRFVVVATSGAAVMLTLGTNYCLGGLSPYIVSRLLEADQLNSNGTSARDPHPGSAAASKLNTGTVVWVFVVAALFQGFGMLASGFLTAQLPFDRRWSIACGCLISSLGTCLTGLTVAVSIGLVILTSGAIFGFGQGLAYALILESVTSWTDDSKGLITGILVSSFAAGAIVFLPIQSKIINPENLTPDLRIGNDRLFSQHEVTSRTPHSFFIMSAIYASVQLLCIGFIRRKPEARSQSGSDQQAGEGTMLIDESGTAQAAPKPDSPIPALEEAQEAAATQWTLQSAVQSLPFFVMGLSIFFLTPASIVLPSLDKAFGETFISNDMLLSVMAGIGGAFNAFGRLVAGIVIDRLHFRVCVLIQGLLLAALHALTPLSALTHPALYFILVCLVNFVFAGVFVFFPYSVEKLYGSALFAQVYGLVFLFKAVAGALIAAVTTAGLGALGWTGILVLTAVTSGIGGLLILLYNTERWKLAIALM